LPAFKNWGCGLSGSMPAYQWQGPEFKPLDHQNNNKKNNNNNNNKPKIITIKVI
jgi:hypothetical protein